ncbi:MAG: SIS domain-containing protein [Bacteroidia bacterium]|nr:SIS domain-containing protein [Bacteroidia bacterium]
MSEITHEKSLEDFASQIEYALKGYSSHHIELSQVDQVILCGLGGSGIGGRITRNYFNSVSPLPVEVYSDYNLPAYACESTLVVLSSYSGETEETLSMFKDAQSRGCYIVCITSGGKLQELAKEENAKTYIVEKGYQPRQALGYSLVYNLLVLAELFDEDLKAELNDVLNIYKDPEHYKGIAAGLLDNLKGSADDKYVVITDNCLEAIGTRFCQQINENAKAEAFINVLPEANHNVFETYYYKLPGNFFFLYPEYNKRVAMRFDFLGDLLEKQGNSVTRLKVKSGSLSDLFKTIYITDWYSVLLSNRRGVDNMTVPNISKLKTYLSEHA